MVVKDLESRYFEYIIVFKDYKVNYGLGRNTISDLKVSVENKNEIQKIFIRPEDQFGCYDLIDWQTLLENEKEGDIIEKEYIELPANYNFTDLIKCLKSIYEKQCEIVDWINEHEKENHNVDAVIDRIKERYKSNMEELNIIKE